MPEWYGKHFESLYSGSMVGAGAVVFAVWGYVIAKMKPDPKEGAVVELNSRLLGFVLGEKEEAIEGAIKRLCEPDERSRSKEEGGKRLVRLGEYLFRVVNGAKYRGIRDVERRKEQNRAAQERYRARHVMVKSGRMLPGEAAAVRAAKEEGEAAADVVAEKVNAELDGMRGGESLETETAPPAAEEEAGAWEK